MQTSQLYYRTFGDRSLPVVVLLHGFMGGANDWEDIVAGLADQARVIVVDLPGHGKSVSLPTDSYSIEGCAALVIALLDELQIEQTALVGYSMGGRLALQIVTQYPSRVNRLVLESAAAGLKDERERRERVASDEQKASELERVPLEQFLEFWYRQPLFASLSDHPDLLSTLLAKRCGNDAHELAQSLRLMGTGNMRPLWDELKNVDIPTLCLAGELDPKYAALSRQMAVAMPNCRAEIISGAGHIVHLEQQETFIARLRAFLIA